MSASLCAATTAALRTRTLGANNWQRIDGGISLSLELEEAVRIRLMYAYPPRAGSKQWFTPYPVSCPFRPQDTPMRRRSAGITDTTSPLEEVILLGMQELFARYEDEIRPYLAGDAVATPPEIHGFEPPCWGGRSLVIPVQYFRVIRLDGMRLHPIRAVIDFGYCLSGKDAAEYRHGDLKPDGINFWPGQGWQTSTDILDLGLAEVLHEQLATHDGLMELVDTVGRSEQAQFELPCITIPLGDFRPGDPIELYRFE